MIESIGKLAGGIAGKSSKGITGGALGLANDITGTAKASKGGGSGKGGKKAQLLQTLLSLIGGAKG